MRIFQPLQLSIYERKGVSVKSIAEFAGGISDSQVIEIAKAEGLIILTFDKDYGELIFKYGMPSPPAVVFFRFKGHQPTASAELLLTPIKTAINLNNSFTVIEMENFRQRSY